MVDRTNVPDIAHGATGHVMLSTTTSAGRLVFRVFAALAAFIRELDHGGINQDPAPPAPTDSVSVRCPRWADDAHDVIEWRYVPHPDRR